MTADVSRHLALEFPAIPADASIRLREILGERVYIANPFDFHTHLWFDRPGLRSVFAASQQAGFDAVGLMVDSPPADQADPSSYVAAIEEFIAASPATPARRVLISSLPESMARPIRERCLAGGVVPLQGQREALEALDLCAGIGLGWNSEPQVRLLRPARASAESVMLAEYEAKSAVAAFGVSIPRSCVCAPAQAAAAADAIGYPVVIKAAGNTLQHKSDRGGVVLNIRGPDQAREAAQRLAGLSDTLLVEQMVNDGVAEVLIGMTVDAQFGQLLVLGAGGTLTELLRDTVALLPPFTADAIRNAISRLSMAKLLAGYRGRPAGDIDALIDIALACTRYAQAHLDRLVELDLNPVIVRPAGRGAVAVDALIRLAKEQ
jgi:acyl-CoA synthetase (NDP forming)